MSEQFRLPATPGTRFAPHALDSWVGQQVPARLRETDGGPVLAELGTAYITAAEVVEDGAAALITYEIRRDQDATT